MWIPAKNPNCSQVPRVSVTITIPIGMNCEAEGSEVEKEICNRKVDMLTVQIKSPNTATSCNALILNGDLTSERY